MSDNDLGLTSAISFEVQEFTPEGHATPLWGVVADYGWATRILFADAYEQDARAICDALTRAAPTDRFCECKGEIAVTRRKGQLFCRGCGGIAPSGTITRWGKNWADVKRMVVE